LSSANILQTKGEGGSLNADVALFGSKVSDFLKSMVRLREQGGGELRQCGHFLDMGSQFFAILCGRLLWTAPNEN